MSSSTAKVKPSRLPNVTGKHPAGRTFREVLGYSFILF
jgi:hypothetical protein